MSYTVSWLQFFAEGAPSGGDAGGEGAASGAESAVAGRSLEELGVPRDKAEHFRQARSRKSPRTVSPDGESAPAETDSGATPAGETTAAIPWEDFMAIPENRQRMQAMMAERGRKATEAKNAYEAAMAKLSPALERLAARYGIAAREGRYDIDAIARAVTDDDSYYREQAEQLGVDVEVVKQLEQANTERRRAEERERAARARQQEQERDFRLQRHFMQMQQQGEALKRLFPDFDLQRELQNPLFLQRTAPESGMSVEDAFYSIHHDEIMLRQAEAIARRARADAAASIRSGVRPRENGSSATAPAAGAYDLKTMNREDRKAYIQAKYAPR